jgi:hypothetical protein
VYALKILRKTEGSFYASSHAAERSETGESLTRRLFTVIKLRQIDHVRHERQILADVSGHPFITNFRASFADHDYLYLLVRHLLMAPHRYARVRGKGEQRANLRKCHVPARLCTGW